MGARQIIEASEPYCATHITRDGDAIYFEDSGGSGPVLFYLYGLGCSHYHWKYSLRYFSGAGDGPRYRQIWMDFRGHGKSPLPAQPLTIDTLVNDTADLCAARGVENITLLGQSMGGSIALQVAHKFPKLVHRLVLLAAPGRDPSEHFPVSMISAKLWHLVASLNKMKTVRQTMTKGWALQLLKKPLEEIVRFTGFNPELSNAEDVCEYVREFLAVPPHLFFDLVADLKDFDASKLQPKISCSTLLVVGGNDRVVPLDHSKWLLQQLPNGQLANIEYGSHCPHFDDPRRVNELIEAFLNG